MAISKIVPQSTGFGDANVGLQIPNISLANRAASAANGTIFFNTSNNAIEVYANGAWTSVGASASATIVSVSGNLFGFDGATQSNVFIDIVGTNFGSGDVSIIFDAGDTEATVVKSPLTESLIENVQVPSSISALAAGTSCSIRLITDNGTTGTTTKTLVGVPTGGTISATGVTRRHTFTTSSNFIVPSSLTVSANVLLVAGGAGGGRHSGGGGGAGGLLYYGVETPKTPNGDKIPLDTGTWVITVGAGGGSTTSVYPGVGNELGKQGSNTSLVKSGTSYVALGGGGGGNETTNGLSGGSGGGGARTANGGSGTPGQGNAGGNGVGNQSPDYTGAGGGGAGAVGGAALQQTAGAGGVGLQYGISGSGTYYAGGGGGNRQTGGSGAAGGLGGGGQGAPGTPGPNPASGVAGTVNTGGGGGGNQYDAALGSGGGGSGIVIITYDLNN